MKLKDKLLEIVDVVNVLIKFDCDDILTNRALFIAFLNEIGIQITCRQLRYIANYITKKEKSDILNQSEISHRVFWNRYSMYDNGIAYSKPNDDVIHTSVNDSSSFWNYKSAQDTQMNNFQVA